MKRGTFFHRLTIYFCVVFVLFSSYILIDFLSLNLTGRSIYIGEFPSTFKIDSFTITILVFFVVIFILLEFKRHLKERKNAYFNDKDYIKDLLRESES
jgi:hypothetical protein